jgi:uncharacterized protein YdeI (YjbR/CyaY-like superfamily)
MGKHDPRIDAYIAKSKDFAQPILRHLRKLIHAGCPEVEETLKWGHPFFTYKGILCGFASFQGHCAFVLWKGSLILGKNRGNISVAMGQFGRITNLKELPSDKILINYIKEAVKLNDGGVKLPQRSKPKEKKKLIVPSYVKTALKKNKKALATFEEFSYTNKKDYLEWITEAKTDETRQKRLTTAIEWMAEGKIRNWKYVRK